MKKVAIITRCFNRLEYTIRCIRSVHEKSGNFNDYTHFIVDQNSSDGTPQWLHSIEVEGYYRNLHVIYNKENSGDAGGIKNVYDILDDSYDYVMQFDSDMEILTNDFLGKLVKVLDEKPEVGFIMMKREGVGRAITSNIKEVIHGDTYLNIRVGTGAFITRKKHLEELNIFFTQQKIGWGHAISKTLNGKGHKVLKCLDNKVYHIDGTGGQVERYPKYFAAHVGRGNYKTIEYSKL